MTETLRPFKALQPWVLAVLRIALLLLSIACSVRWFAGCSATVKPDDILRPVMDFSCMVCRSGIDASFVPATHDASVE